MWHRARQSALLRRQLAESTISSHGGKRRWGLSVKGFRQELELASLQDAPYNAPAVELRSMAQYQQDGTKEDNLSVQWR